MNAKIIDWQSIAGLDKKETATAFIDVAKTDARRLPILGMLRYRSRELASDDDSPLDHAKKEAERAGLPFHSIDNAKYHERAFALVRDGVLPYEKYMALTYREATELSGSLSGKDSRESVLAYLGKTKFGRGWTAECAKRGDAVRPDADKKKPDAKAPATAPATTAEKPKESPEIPENVVQFEKPKTAIEAFGEIQSLAKMLDDKQLEALRSMLARWANEPAKFHAFKAA